jgi:hypothetical protein
VHRDVAELGRLRGVVGDTVTPGPSLRHFDPFDLHLALVAVRDGADLLCTSNTTDYTMDSIGNVRIATPGALADDYGLR